MGTGVRVFLRLPFAFKYDLCAMSREQQFRISQGVQLNYQSHLQRI